MTLLTVSLYIRHMKYTIFLTLHASNFGIPVELTSYPLLCAILIDYSKSHTQRPLNPHGQPP